MTSLRSGIAKKFGKEFAEMLVPYQEGNSFIKQIKTINDKEIKNVNKSKQGKGEEKKNSPILQRKEPEKIERKGKINNAVPKGSNAWAISGKYTDTGKPILATDPHLVHTIPSALYIATLKFPDGLEIAGATSSGIPFVVIGRNNYIAWGITMSMIENVDLYSITLSQDKKEYQYNQTWKALYSKNVTIKVRWGGDIQYEVYKSHHGPILHYPISPQLGTFFSYLNIFIL